VGGVEIGFFSIISLCSWRVQEPRGFVKVYFDLVETTLV